MVIQDTKPMPIKYITNNHKDIERVLAARAARASGRVSPTDMFLNNKAINSKRKACQDGERRRRAAAASPASEDDDDDELEVPATVRRKTPVTARKVAPMAPLSDDDDEEEETPVSSRRKLKTTSTKDITRLLRKLKLNSDERKTEKKKHGRRA